MTFTLYLPIDASVRRLVPDAARAELPPLLQRATRLHTLRTTFFTAGFFCFVVSAVLT